MHSHTCYLLNRLELKVVLILVVMEDALAPADYVVSNVDDAHSLNPCCNGRCTRTQAAQKYLSASTFKS